MPKLNSYRSPFYTFWTTSTTPTSQLADPLRFRGCVPPDHANSEATGVEIW